MIKTNQSLNPFGKGKVQAHKHIASGAYFHTRLFGSSLFQKFRQQTDIFIRLFIEKLDVTAVWYNLFTNMGDMFFQQLE